jgi:glycosyltransferase involved in cell wall biosynthesis
MLMLRVAKVSVIIPTYNRAEFLRSAITSVLNQTYQDFEIIVVDDGSTDNMQAVVCGFNDKRIKYVRNDVNEGEARTRNIGIMNSNAEYIAFLDDDDEWLPEKLKLQIDLLENSPAKVGVVYTGYVEVDRYKNKILRQFIPTKKGNIYNDIYLKNYVGVPSTVVLRRACFERLGLFDESVVYPTDYDMWIRISMGFYFEYIEKPLVRYYIHENTISSNLELRIRGIETMLKKYGQIFSLNSKAHSRYFIRLGVLYCCNGNPKKGRESFLKATSLYPFKISNYLYLGLSLLGTKNFRRLQSSLKRPFL